MYKILNRKKPRINDGFHIMQNIVRAVDERFHVDKEFYDLETENYNNYFQQCIDNGFIVRVKGKHYLAEEFNVTPKGHTFHKKSKGKFSLEQTINYGIGTTKVGYESEL